MAGTWKTVRVFISSTFRDMQAERDRGRWAWLPCGRYGPKECAVADRVYKDEADLPGQDDDDGGSEGRRPGSLGKGPGGPVAASGRAG
jgi:hypothetical protein